MIRRIGINGFGRMGRLALRAGWSDPMLDFVHINEIEGGQPCGLSPCPSQLPITEQTHQ